jgi:hypothetical protein
MNDRSFLSCRKRDTLSAGIGALIKLTGKVLNGENVRTFKGRQFIMNNINRRLGKYTIFFFFLITRVNTFCKVTVNNSHPFNVFQLQSKAQISSGVLHESVFLFNVYFVNAQCFPLFAIILVTRLVRQL